MTGSLQIAVTAVGGLALFIYGMGLMSDGLKETAGSKLKAVLGYMTKNRFFAIAAGAGVTALIQSSSATSVMTVGFVNAGLLSLEQAIGVIFGANIGTTITGQIVSLKLDDLALRYERQTTNANRTRMHCSGRHHHLVGDFIRILDQPQRVSRCGRPPALTTRTFADRSFCWPRRPTSFSRICR